MRAYAERSKTMRTTKRERNVRAVYTKFAENNRQGSGNEILKKLWDVNVVKFSDLRTTQPARSQTRNRSGNGILHRAE